MKESFVFYESFYQAIKDLNNDIKAEFVTALCEYCLYDNEIELQPFTKALFVAVKPTIDNTLKRYYASVENGKKGGRPKKPNDNPTKTQQKPKQNLEKPNDNLYVDVYDDVYVDVDVDVNNKDKSLLFNKGKTKKTDPFISNIKTYFLEQYIEVFGNKPILTFNECNKLNELNVDIENFKDTINGVLNKTKKIKFEFESGQNFKPDVHWILKEDNYIKVLDGTYNNQAGESEYELEVKKRIEQEHQMIKEKEEQEAKERQKRIEEDSHIETESERLIREEKEKEEMGRRKIESIERQNKVAQMFRRVR